MFNINDIYDYLMEFTPESEGDSQIWQGLATKLYMDITDKSSNKLFDVMQKAKNLNINVPDEEMQSAWQFLKDNQSKISSPEDLEKIVLEYGFGRSTSTENPTGI